MTAEQIIQKAEAFAMKVAESHIVEKRPAYIAAFNAFMSGAHSRDEEIKQWKDSKHKLRMRLMQQIHELRNPWISVEERLPELSKKEGSFSSEDVLVRIKSEKGLIYYAVAVYYPRSKDWCIRNEQDKVTHWMPIPHIEKGE